IFIKNGYLWNAGIFMFNSKIFKEEVKKHSFNIHSSFQNNYNIKNIFEKIDSISIDYGLLEKTSNITVVPADIDWNDLGDYDSFYNVFKTNKNNNIIDNESILFNSKNNLIKLNTSKIIVGIDINNLIIVDTDDALLVCKKGSSQKIKDVVKKLSKNNDQRVNYHLEDHRPWGKYKVLEEKDTSKVKRITVLPGKRLSYQLHKYRKEHWYVVKGNAKVTIDNEIFNLKAGESVFIKKEQKHRVENNGDEILEFIEVQTGSYLEEDDIIRFDDDFDR
ncbi:MAG TPA: cupin domain-containing protein, partial [Patescibacteria group bacterium]|nr:cupin domain-containing protein [Patescibacteria group bacterium]